MLLQSFRQDTKSSSVTSYVMELLRMPPSFYRCVYNLESKPRLLGTLCTELFEKCLKHGSVTPGLASKEDVEADYSVTYSSRVP